MPSYQNLMQKTKKTKKKNIKIRNHAIWKIKIKINHMHIYLKEKSKYQFMQFKNKKKTEVSNTCNQESKF